MDGTGSANAGAACAAFGAPREAPQMRSDASWSLVWLALGHGHWGLTLGPVTGRLVADLLTGQTRFCDPTPYVIQRFAKSANFFDDLPSMGAAETWLG